jgi:hypothetical protein
VERFGLAGRRNHLRFNLKNGKSITVVTWP